MKSKVSDYFAELYVAGRFAEAGWNVYFPHRDHGFDFIVAKQLAHCFMLRPVQVKGKYPMSQKLSQPFYGYVGGLTQLHDEMVLAIPFFDTLARDAPTCIGYFPRKLVRPTKTGFQCQPARYNGIQASPRAHFAKFFDASGLALLESPDWTGMDPILDA